MTHWLSRTTLDIIGAAGFDYAFDTLSHGEESNPLASAFDKVFRGSTSAVAGILMLTIAMPFLRPFIGRKTQRDFAAARRQMDVIGMQLISEKKAALQSAKERGEKPTSRDILTLLLQQNMSDDVPPAQRLTDADVLARKNGNCYASAFLIACVQRCQHS